MTAADLYPSAPSGTLNLDLRPARKPIKTQALEQQRRPLNPATAGFLSFQEAKMPAAGRPRGTDHTEIERRRQEFDRLISNGESFAEAAKAARLQPQRVLAILDEQPEVRQIVAYLLSQQPESAAA